MNELNQIPRLNRVGAPSDFERRVLAELAKRKEQKHRLRRTYGLTFAGAAAVLAVFILLNVLVLKKPEGIVSAGNERIDSSSSVNFIPVMETLDYSNEVRNVSHEPQTIYILEQVSEASSSEITY